MNRGKPAKIWAIDKQVYRRIRRNEYKKKNEVEKKVKQVEEEWADKDKEEGREGGKEKWIRRV